MSKVVFFKTFQTRDDRGVLFELGFFRAEGVVGKRVQADAWRLVGCKGEGLYGSGEPVISVLSRLSQGMNVQLRRLYGCGGECRHLGFGGADLSYDGLSARLRDLSIS
jgi:hypothetical protein